MVTTYLRSNKTIYYSRVEFFRLTYGNMGVCVCRGTWPALNEWMQLTFMSAILHHACFCMKTNTIDATSKGRVVNLVMEYNKPKHKLSEFVFIIWHGHISTRIVYF